MKEDFLHYIWKYRLFTAPLFTVNGEAVEVLSPGIHNHHAGPDFSDARLRIGSTLWAGNVEIHVNTSDWTRHGHHTDPVYDSVVLHVVYQHDQPVHLNNLPVAEIKNCIDMGVYNKYRTLMAVRNRVPCHNQVKEVAGSETELWLERMLIERIESRSGQIAGFLQVNSNDWEEAFYMMLARSFGFSLNALPFEMLARSLPYRILAKHAGNPMQCEALIFGQAGLLSHGLADAWPQELFSEYSFLRKKYDLVPVAAHLWKFMRLRPANFPHIRLAQFAAFLSRRGKPLPEVLSCSTAGELTALFDVAASPYWDTQFQFDKPNRKQVKHLGKSSATLIIINAVLPFMFVYGRETGQDHLCNRALNLFSQFPPESNRITRQWEQAGLSISTAFHSQALISLKTDYCDNYRCLECRIGNLLLRSSGEKA